MKYSSQVDALFTDSINAIQTAQQQLCTQVSEASILMAEAIKAGNKIMVCGNGGSACDSQHFSGELLNKFERIRRPLAAISLAADISTITSIANDESYDQVFSKQVEALAMSGDVLVVITTSGNSPSIVKAVKAAQQLDVKSIALNGKSGGKLTTLISDNDINIVVDSNSTARVQEVHGIIIHAFCELIDHQLFGGQL